MKKSLIILLTALFSLVGEVRAEASEDFVGLQETTIQVADKNVRVNGGAGLVLEVYKITGEQVMVMRIDSDNKTFRLNLPKGCYILRVGNVTRKVSIC